MVLRGALYFVLVFGVVSCVWAIDNTTDVKKDSCSRGRCLIDILEGLRGTYQLLPGVNISASSVAVRSSSAREALATYLRSVTLHVALYEPVVTFFSSFKGLEAEGRAKRRPSYYYRPRFRYLLAYVVFAVAFALLSALVGKAVTISIIALVLAAVAAVRGVVGFGAASPANSPPVFDIVRRPHIQVSHTHSAEEVYEAPGTSGGVSYVSYPLRSRAVPVLDNYLPETAHIAEGRPGERHIHIS